MKGLRDGVTIMNDTTHTMRCAGCGHEIDENMAPYILDENGIDSEGDILCEGCAEDQLDSCIAVEADARECGLDHIDEYEG